MSSLDEISAAIGELRAQTTVLLRLQERHSDETADIRLELQTVSTDLKIVKQDVATFKPAAKKVEKWEQRAVGMSVLGGLFGSGVLAWLKSKGWI